MSKTFSANIDKNFDVSLPSTFCFVLSRFYVFLSDGSSKTLQKTFTKKSCRKVFAKKSTKIVLFLFLLSRFWAFLGGGEFKNMNKKSEKKPDQPWYFFGLQETNQPPTTSRPVGFCFECPLARGWTQGGVVSAAPNPRCQRQMQRGPLQQKSMGRMDLGVYLISCRGPAALAPFFPVGFS
jgi:hypothetical protein